MAEEEFTDINGNSISLDCQTHSAFCREFIVTSPKLSLRKVMVYTCFIWLFAYAIFFFTEVRTFYNANMNIFSNTKMRLLHF